MLKREDRRRIFLVLALGAVMSLGHTDPFGDQPFDRDQPFDTTPPVKLTLNQGPDRRPAWLADGSGFLYSSQLIGTAEHDVCLAQLPPVGGSQRGFTCALAPNSGNLTDALESAAPAADGRLAYVAATSRIGASVPDSQNLVLATVGDPSVRQSLHSLPYAISPGRIHQGVSQIHWLGANRIVFLGEAVNVTRVC